MRFWKSDDVPAAWIIDDLDELRDPPAPLEPEARLPVPEAPSQHDDAQEPTPPPRVVIIEI